MTGTKKVAIKSLSHEINIVKEKSNEIDILKEKVFCLEKIVKGLEGNKSIQNVNIDFAGILSKCKICDKSFDSRKTLKIHLIEVHPRKMKCRACEDSFNKMVIFGKLT